MLQRTYIQNNWPGFPREHHNLSRYRWVSVHFWSENPPTCNQKQLRWGAIQCGVFYKQLRFGCQHLQSTKKLRLEKLEKPCQNLTNQQWRSHQKHQSFTFRSNQPPTIHRARETTFGSKLVSLRGLFRQLQNSFRVSDQGLYFSKSRRQHKKQNIQTIRSARTRKVCERLHEV